MKKIFILVLFLFLVLMPNQAWAILRLGLQGGLSSSTAATNTGYNLNKRTGIGFGAFVELGTGGSFTFQPEVNYMQKGAEVTYTGSYFGSTITAASTVRLNYLEIPANFKYTFDIPIIKPFVSFGPYLAFLMGSDYQLVSTTTSLSNLKSTDYGFMGTGGVELAFSPFMSLFASLRYSIGLAEVDSGSTQWKNRNWLFHCGLLLGF